MTRRRPSADELALWRKVAEATEPLLPEKKSRFPIEAASAPAAPKGKPAPVAAFQVGEKARSDSAATFIPDAAQTPLRMDKKAFARMKRGKLKPEAKLDLHGMTLDRAHDATTGFILQSQARDLRLVLIVTGKGKRREDVDVIPERQGVLRHHLPHWLSTPPLAQMILQVTEAHGRHGGGGAFYVYLRRRR